MVFLRQVRQVQPPTHTFRNASHRLGGKQLHIRRVCSRVLAVDQVDNHFNHDLPLVRLALGNQQGKRNQGIIGNALFAVGVIQKILALQKPDKNSGGDPLVAVSERMVLDDKVQQIGGLLLDAGIKLLAVEGLVNRLQRALE